MRARFSGLLACLVSGLALMPGPACLAGPGGPLRIEVVDRDTKQPLACRMHLVNAAGRALKAPKVPFWHDHFVFSGTVTLKLPKGEYSFEIERGPEYLVRSGHFTMDDFSEDTKVIDLKRVVDMAAEHWWSGDLDVQRPDKDLPLLMEAEDLHVVELIAWPGGKKLLSKPSTEPLVNFDGNRYYHLGGGSDARAGGALLLLNLPKPLDLSGPEPPSQLESLAAAAAQEGAWIDVQKASSWDLPLWISSGHVRSVQLANSSLRRTTSADSETGAKPRDKFLFPGPAGQGRWSEKIYYQLLNCGLRIPPTAGSGSGTANNPLGYNRMYAYVELDFDYERWWQAVAEGQVVVTNGPLLRPNVEGEMPGHIFRAAAGEELELQVGLTLSTRDRISYLEVVANGELVQQYRLDEWAKMGGRLPPLKFKESGWFVLRAVADVPGTYRFATTGPYYVEIGDQPRISKSAAQFFLDWLDERAAMGGKLPKGAARETTAKQQATARAYWQNLVDRANAP